MNRAITIKPCLSESRLSIGSILKRVTAGDEGVVFYRRGGELVCLCQLGSHYLDEIEAELITVQAIRRAARQ